LALFVVHQRGAPCTTVPLFQVVKIKLEKGSCG